MNDRFVVALDGSVREMVEDCKTKCRAKTIASVVRLSISLLHKALNQNLYCKSSDGTMERIVII